MKAISTGWACGSLRALLGALLVGPIGCAGAAGPTGGVAAAVEGVARLEVRVLGLASDAGQVAFALFDSAEAFRAGAEPVRRGFLGVEDRDCRWTVEGLPRGDYALKVYHDLDGNGRLDTGALGIPSEPYGFSNDARGRFGPPAYGRARFRVAEAVVRIAVTVR